MPVKGLKTKKASPNTTRALDLSFTESDINKAEKRRQRWAADLPAWAAECATVIDRDAPGGDQLIKCKFVASQLYLHDIITRMEQINLERSTEQHAADPSVPITKLPIKIRALKARKVRWSTYFQLRIFHRCEFVPGTSALTMAHERGAARNIADMSRRIHIHWPDGLHRVPIDRVSDDLIEWNDLHDSRILVKTAGSKSGGSSASYTYQLDHFSEAALYPEDTEEIVSALAASAKYCEQYFESTARGDNHFKTAWDHALWIEEVERIWHNREPFPEDWNGEVRAFWAWWQDPGYRISLQPYEEEIIAKTLTKDEIDGRSRFGWDLEQVKWRRDKLRGEALQQTELRPEDYVKREYPSSPEEAFQSSGSTAFQHVEPLELMERVADHITRAMSTGRRLNGLPHFVGNLVRDDSLPERYKLVPITESTNDPITERMLLMCNFIMWTPPKPNTAYVFATDTAEGLDTGDDSVVTVFDRTDGLVLKEVARLIGKVPAEPLADLSFFIGTMYNDAFWVGERGPHGRPTCVRMVKLGYRNMYHYKNPEQFSDREDPETFTAGFRTGPDTKPLLVAGGEKALRDESIVLYSKRAIQQWKALQNINGKIHAPTSGATRHDDCVITDLLCIFGNQLGVAPPVWVGMKQPTRREADDQAKLSSEEAQNLYWREKLAEVRKAEVERHSREVAYGVAKLASFREILD